jgi:hypothetical protein
MKLAWESQTKHAITAADVHWTVEPVSMPVRDTLIEEAAAGEAEGRIAEAAGPHPCGA